MSITNDSYSGHVAAEGTYAGWRGRRSRVSWGAILAGAFVAVAVGLMLHLLGVGIGGMMVDATERATPDAATFGVGAALVMLIANLAGLAAGGYTAARLSGTRDETDAELHGLVMWAAAFLVSAVVLGNLIAGVASTAATGAANVAGGAMQGAGAAAAAATEAAAENPSATDAIIGRATSALNTGGDPATMSPDQRKAEIAMLLARRVSDGSFAEPDRDRLTALVAADAGISPQDAQGRVTQAEQQVQQAMQQAEETARAAADTAASAAALMAFAMFLTMLLGIVAAIMGARMGFTAHRVYQARIGDDHAAVTATRV